MHRRLLLVVLLGACAPVVATVQPVDGFVSETDEPDITARTEWTGAWLPMALDRLLLRGTRDDTCLQLRLVAPASWESDYPVEVSEPWALELAVWSEGPCGDDPWQPEPGEPLLPDELEGSIVVNRDFPPEQVSLDLRAEVDGQVWVEDTTVEIQY